MFAFIFYYEKGEFLFPSLLLIGSMGEDIFFILTVFLHSNPHVEVVSPPAPFKKNPVEPHFPEGTWLHVRHQI